MIQLDSSLNFYSCQYQTWCFKSVSDVLTSSLLYFDLLYNFLCQKHAVDSFYLCFGFGSWSSWLESPCRYWGHRVSSWSQRLLFYSLMFCVDLPSHNWYVIPSWGTLWRLMILKTFFLALWWKTVGMDSLRSLLSSVSFPDFCGKLSTIVISLA